MVAQAFAALDPDAFKWGDAFRQGRERREQEDYTTQLAQLLSQNDYEGAIGAAAGRGDLENVLGLQGAQREQDAYTREQQQALGQITYNAARELAAIPDPMQRRAYAAEIAAEARRRGLPFGDFDDQELSDEFLSRQVQSLGQVFGHADQGEPFTLSPGAGRYDAQGGLIAQQPFKEDSEPSTAIFDPTTGQMIYGTGDAVTSRMNDRADRGMLDSARETATQAAKMANIYTDMQALLDAGVETGFGRDISGNLQRAYGAAGDASLAATGRDLPGAEGAREAGRGFEQFNALSREAGAQALSLFGGSDTERELLVAIQTNPGPTYDEATNRAILDRKMRALRLATDMPQILNEFLRRYPGGVTPDGRTWDRYWMDYQTDALGVNPIRPSSSDGGEIDQPRTDLRRPENISQELWDAMPDEDKALFQ